MLIPWGPRQLTSRKQISSIGTSLLGCQMKGCGENEVMSTMAILAAIRVHQRQ